MSRLRTAEALVLLAGLIDAIASTLYQGGTVSANEMSPLLTAGAPIVALWAMKALWAGIIVGIMEFIARALVPQLRELIYAVYFVAGLTVVAWTVGAATNILDLARV